jgi:hypothetical protein
VDTYSKYSFAALPGVLAAGLMAMIDGANKKLKSVQHLLLQKYNTLQEENKNSL